MTGIAPEGRQGLPGLEKGLLEQVVSIFMAVHKTADVPVQLLAVLAHKFAEYAFAVLHYLTSITCTISSVEPSG